MTTAKAAEVAAAIITAGYPVNARQIGPDSWVIRSQSGAFDVPVDLVADFVAAKAINGNLAEVEYS